MVLPRTDGGRRVGVRIVSEYPRSGLFDRKAVFAGDLELDFHCKLFPGFNFVKVGKLVVYGGEILTQLIHLFIAHEEGSRRHVVGGYKDGVFGPIHLFYITLVWRPGYYV